MSEEVAETTVETVESPALLDTEGNFTEDFYNTFDEDDRTAISQYKSPGELGKGHINLRRTFDKPADRVLVMPDDNSTDEERAAYSQRIGVPQEASGYEFEADPELKNLTIDDDKLNRFRDIAKKHNIPKSEFSGMVNEWLAGVSKDATDLDAIMQHNANVALEADNKIMDEHYGGQAKDDIVALANSFLNPYSTDIKNEKGEVTANSSAKLIERFPGLEHSPWFVMLCDNFRNAMSPARFHGTTGKVAPTNASMRVRIDELMAKPAYTDISHPDNKRLNAEVLEMYNKINA